MVRKVKRRKKDRSLLGELDGRIQAALGVMTQEEADAIIGEPEEGYTLLGSAVQPLHQILLRLAYNNGLHRSDRVLKAWSQHMILVAVLVHYAYALGIRRGRGENGPTG